MQAYVADKIILIPWKIIFDIDKEKTFLITILG